MTKPLDLDSARQIAARMTKKVTSEELCNAPTVSVAFMCFNQVNFVESALSSIFAQRTDFKFEVIIGDDGSTDGTEEIVKRFQVLHPDKVVLLLAVENMGKHTGNGRINFLRCLESCRGEFVTFLEGDDNWSHSEKLQLQVDYLRDNLDCSLCHHRVEHITDTGRSQRLSVYPYSNDKIDLRDLYRTTSNPVYTGSVCYRRKHFVEVPEPFLNLGLMDWPLVFCLLQHGNAGFIDKPMSQYRVHDGGIWSKKSLFFKSWQKLRAMKKVIRELELDVCHLQQRLLTILRLQLANGLAESGMHLRSRTMRNAVWKRHPWLSLAYATKARIVAALVSFKRLVINKNRSA